MVRAAAFLVLTMLWGVGAGHAQTLASAGRFPERCEDVPAWLATAAGIERVVNPVVTGAVELAGQIEVWRGLVECLEIVPDRGAGVEAAAAYADLFLTFVDPAGPSDRLDLVDLASSPDPAVRRLRDDVGIPAPPGFVFVRYFPSADQMPPRIRGAFDNPQTRAVTIGTRYVAVLAPAPRSGTEAAMLDDALEATFSHELVHAYLNSGLGARILDSGFPRWFHEGMAIHFSGSGRGHVAIDHGAGSIFTIAPTVAYEQYERVFLFLEDRLGPDGFRAAVADAVRAGDHARLLAAAGFDDYEQARLETERWWRWRPIPVEWLVAPGLWFLLAVLAAGAILAWRLWRGWQPAVPNSALEVGVNADLFEAVQSADDDAVIQMLRSGAEPNAVDPEGWTPLHWAVFLNRARSVEALLGAGARPTDALMHFADSRDTVPEIIRLLADTLASPDDDVWS